MGLFYTAPEPTRLLYMSWPREVIIIIIIIITRVYGLRLLLVSRVWRSAVEGKCRPIRLLSGAVSMQCTHRYAAAEDSLSYLWICRDTTCDLMFVPPDTAPPQKTIIVDIYSLVSVTVGTADVRDGDFGGHIWGGDKCPTRFTYKRHL